MLLRQKLWLTLVVLVNAALWLVPSNVVKLIACDEQTLLGRYSRTHFSWIAAVFILSLVSFYIDWSRGKTYKRRWFQVLSVVVFMIPSLLAVDWILRTPSRSHYIKDTLAYHRPVNQTFRGDFVDKPEAHRTYPNAPQGFPQIERVLRTDARGFRNEASLDHANIVVLGDSFAEGSGVSDEHPWPVLLAKNTGLSICNLGMSGYNPANYLASLKEVGLGLKPKLALCLIYEGNDFRYSEDAAEQMNPGLLDRLSVYRKQSPLIEAADQFFVNTFGPINSTGEIEGATAIDWMPVAVPRGPQAKFYAFAPKQLRDLYKSREQFAADRKWLAVEKTLVEMHQTCTAHQIQLVLAFAPMTAHVILPLIKDYVAQEKVRAFTALDYRKPLPDPPVFMAELMAHVDAREELLREWCDRRKVPFICTTLALRQAAADGIQVSFTYDEHWTPRGHEVVAETIAKELTVMLRTN